MSVYLALIVDAETGEVVYQNTPLAAHVELVENLKRRVREKSVGLGRSANHVAEEVGDAMHELLLDLKKHVPPKRA